ncbi:hypothetical protein D3C75_689840 [compost metagenome]
MVGAGSGFDHGLLIYETIMRSAPRVPASHSSEPLYVPKNRLLKRGPGDRPGLVGKEHSHHPLAHHRGRAERRRRPHLGGHRLPAGGHRGPAHLRQAERSVRPGADAQHRHRPVSGGVGSLRPCPGSADPAGGPRAAGAGWRGADRAGLHRHRRLHSPAGGGQVSGLHLGRLCGLQHRRAPARGLLHRAVELALDLLDQPAPRGARALVGEPQPGPPQCAPP